MMIQRLSSHAWHGYNRKQTFCDVREDFGVCATQNILHVKCFCTVHSDLSSFLSHILFLLMLV